MNTETELIPAGAGPDLEQMDRADVPAIWSGYLEKFTSLKASADSVLESDPSNPMSAKLARTARLEFRKARIEIEAKRKELGETYLRKKQAVDGEANKLKELIEPYEERLLAIEQHAERVESDRIETLQLLPDLRVITEEQFQVLLTDMRTLHEARMEAALKTERERLEKEKADAEERERMRLENEHLKKEVEAREAQVKAERDRAEKARVEAETKARKELEAIESKARAERDEVERKAKAEREAAEEKAAAERAAREKLEAANRARLKAEVDAKAAAEKAVKKAAAAPDRQKLAAFVLLLRGLPLPALTTRSGLLVKADLFKRVESLAEWVESEANEI